MSFAYVLGVLEPKSPENSTNGKPAIPNGHVRVANGLFSGFNRSITLPQIDEFRQKAPCDAILGHQTSWIRLDNKKKTASTVKWMLHIVLPKLGISFR